MTAPQHFMISRIRNLCEGSDMALNIISDVISCRVIVYKLRASVWLSRHHECSINIIVKPIDCVKLPPLQKMSSYRQPGSGYIRWKRQDEIGTPVLAQRV